MNSRAFRAVLTAGTVLAGLIAPAWADGGAGGAQIAGFGAGPAGGTGFGGNNPGASASGGAYNGGGGGGAGGGAGGLGGRLPVLGSGGGGNGGVGGANFITGDFIDIAASIVGGSGGDGTDARIGFDAALGAAAVAGGGGGGAGGYGAVAGAGGINESSGSIFGGQGGKGGANIGPGSGGGNGGDGGVGVQLTATGSSFTNSGKIVGGNGGNGGLGNTIQGVYGNGGNGGAGVQFAGPGTLTNTGTITGGNGGTATNFVFGTSGSPGAGGAGIVGSGLTVINGGTIIGGMSGDGVTRANAITFTGGTNTLTLMAGSTITGNVVAFSGADTLALGGSGLAGFDVSQIGAGAQYSNFGVFQKTGTSTWVLTGSSAAYTPWTISGGVLAISADGSLGAVNSTLTLAGGTLLTTASFTSTRATTLGAGTNTFDTTGGTALTWNGDIGGTGGLTKSGTGTLILGGNNAYSGGTTVSVGVLQGNSASLQGSILNNAAVVFHQNRGGTYDGSMSGSGSMTLQGGGKLTMTGSNTYLGPTTVSGSTLVVNGSLASTVTLDSGSYLGGSGSIGGLIANGATLLPGNSIGTMTVTGAFTQNGGAYQLEVNGQGQNDRINVGGPATINGGTVQVTALPGIYAISNTYTILNAAGGVAGAYARIRENLAFLTPTLSYDANNVYLTLALQGNPFAGGGNTSNQQAAGSALDRSFANATGDLATVIGAIAGLDTTFGPLLLDAISGQQYADFGSVNVAGASLFMNALGQQMALARGGAGNGQRQALAQACDVASCDAAGPFTSWASLLGGVGSLQGDANASTLTYNMGGVAAGLDYRVDPRFLLGLGVGYANGTQWVNGFNGKGWTNSASVAAYASFTQGGFYADALAGYAYANNQLQRQIVLPFLQPRLANGSAGANQFLGQVETGYKVAVYAPAEATVTPFVRLQAISVNQGAFSEWGANSLSLNVAQQTTNALRSTFGADLAGAIGLGEQRQLALVLRLGWLHDYADTGRPITSAFAGAPSAAFTVYGATAVRNSAVIGLSAGTYIADATQVYLRYDGELGSGSDNHALTAGLRLSW